MCCFRQVQSRLASYEMTRYFHCDVSPDIDAAFGFSSVEKGEVRETWPHRVKRAFLLGC